LHIVSQIYIEDLVKNLNGYCSFISMVSFPKAAYSL
jgi:hypothetical protein